MAGYVSDADAVKEFWGKLRDRYYQAKQRVRKRLTSGAAADSAPLWCLWNQMKWLDDYMTSKQAYVLTSSHRNAMTVTKAFKFCFCPLCHC